MSTKKEREQHLADELARLRKIVKPGSTVYTIVRSRSRSNMSRVISLYVRVGSNFWNITHSVACVLGLSLVYGHVDGVRVHGAGTNMCFHTVYTLGRTLFPKGGTLSSQLLLDIEQAEPAVLDNLDTEQVNESATEAVSQVDWRAIDPRTGNPVDEPEGCEDVEQPTAWSLLTWGDFEKREPKYNYGNAELSLCEMGEKMHHWHNAMMDPIYIVGSLFFSGTDYPDLSIVASARDALARDLGKCKLDRAHRRRLARGGCKNRIGAESVPEQWLHGWGPDEQDELTELVDALTDYLNHFEYREEGD